MRDAVEIAALEAEVDRTFASPGFRYFWMCLRDVKQDLVENILEFPISSSADEVAMNHCKAVGMIEGIATIERMKDTIVRSLREGREPRFAGEDRNLQEGDPDARS